MVGTPPPTRGACSGLDLDTRAPSPPDNKVFSSFSSFLRVIGAHLKAKGIEFCFLDGATNSKRRKEELIAFSDLPEKRVMLLSLKAGGVSAIGGALCGRGQLRAASLLPCRGPCLGGVSPRRWCRRSG